jgi:aryl-alcohol dehydrogenase-like predicted oxidoreductase
MPELKKRRLGRTELMVTELSFGAMNLRLLKSHAEAQALVHTVLDHQVNLIDTARAYQAEIEPGVILESEQVVGEVIRQRKNLAEPLVIVTKGHAYTIESMEEELAASLRTLGVSGKGTLKIGTMRSS